MGVQAGAAAVDEERRRHRVRAQLVAAAGVDPQGAEGGGVHRHDPGLAELRPAHGQYALVEVHVVAVEPARLADPQPARRRAARSSPPR